MFEIFQAGDIQLFRHFTKQPVCSETAVFSSRIKILIVLYQRVSVFIFVELANVHKNITIKGAHNRK